MNLREQLIGFEGVRNESYPDALTNAEPWTIGVGHCGPEVCPGLVWSDRQIQETLDHDIEEKTQQCQAAFPWFDGLNEPRQAVIIGMCFQMGLDRLKNFVNTLAMVQAGNYERAADGLRNSRWARQTPRRAVALARQMETGEWHVPS